ncbi:MAG: hypothetical protein B7Z50_01965, partial [Sphingomonadales bacterium 12-62-5]
MRLCASARLGLRAARQRGGEEDPSRHTHRRGGEAAPLWQRLHRSALGSLSRLRLRRPARVGQAQAAAHEYTPGRRLPLRRG